MEVPPTRNRVSGMRLLICGSRWFGHRDSPVREKEKNCFYRVVGSFEKEPDLVIIQGGARGADRLAKEFAHHIGCGHEEYAADWETYGKGAGRRRNRQMLKQGQPELVIAFYHRAERSAGTFHMVGIAHQAEVEVWEIFGPV